jgi:hypothetical protein
MKRPKAPQIAAEVQDRLQERLDRFLAEDESIDGGKDSAAVLLLCIDLYSIAHRFTGTVAEVAELFEFASYAAEWDTEEPHLAHIQKYLNRLFSGSDHAAYMYIDRAIKQKIAAEAGVAAATMSRNGSKGGTAAQLKKVEAIAQAQQHYQLNHTQFKNKKEAARRYEELFPPVKFSTYYRVLRTPKV